MHVLNDILLKKIKANSPYFSTFFVDISKTTNSPYFEIILIAVALRREGHLSWAWLGGVCLGMG